MAASVLATFAGIAATLAAVGLFAVVGGWFTECTPEIGVRIALGADAVQCCDSSSRADHVRSFRDSQVNFPS